LLTLAMRRNGVSGATPSNPRIVALAEAGVTPQAVEDACAEAHATHPGERIAPAYIASILERWGREASLPHEARAPRQANGQGVKFDERSQDRKSANAQLTGKRASSGDVIDMPMKEISDAKRP
jgi:hypothetical protein